MKKKYTQKQFKTLVSCSIMLPVARLLLVAVLLFGATLPELFAQAPTVSYSSPQVYTAGQAITPLVPTSSGVVAATSTLAVLSSSFSNVFGVAADANGNVYVAEPNSSTIKKIPAGGGAPVVVGSGFLQPMAVAVDVAGNVYIADAGSKAIKEILSGGGPVITLLSGLSSPSSVAVDVAGNVFAVDNAAKLIYKIPVGGGNAVTVATSIPAPTGIATDAAGNLYIINGGGIDKIVASTGSVIVLDNGSNGWVDGMAIDAAGDVYFSNSFNSTIKRIPAGGGTAVSITPAPSGADALAVDGANNLYISNGLNVVSKLKPAGGYFISPSLPAGLIFNNNTGAISGTPLIASPATNYTVTAVNNASSSTATVNIQVITHNADLSALQINSGLLSPSFAAGTTTYTATVNTDTASVMVKPVTFDPQATVTVNGLSVTRGAASAAVSLLRGANVIPIVVTSRDNVTSKTYALNINRAALTGLNNAHLSNLIVSSGALSPAFAEETTRYMDTVGNATSSITITPTTSVGTATLTVNGVAVASGTASARIPLSIGSNTVNIAVTAADGITLRNYTVVVLRPSNDAYLSSLSLFRDASGSQIGLNGIPFSKTLGSYTASVNDSVTSVTEIITADDVGASVTINGVRVIPGTGSANIPLNMGANTLTTVVTAQDGVTSKTYTVVITRKKSSFAALSALTFDTGTLSPHFVTTITGYTLTLNNPATSVTIKPTATDILATIFLNGSIVQSGKPVSFPVTAGANNISIQVLAEDGVTSKIYNIAVVRAYADATLSGLSLTNGSLSPVFAPGITNYTTTVGNTTALDVITPTATYTGATIKVDGVSVSSGTPSGNISLAVGNTTINVTVTAQDGVTRKTYAVVITRVANNAYLSSLILSSGTLSPAFSLTNGSYTAAISGVATSVIVTPTLNNPHGSIKVNGVVVESGTASAGIPLVVGPNTISVLVTAQDGVTHKTYTVTITRPSNNAYLAGLSLSSGTLSPAFSLANGTYTTSVNNAISSVIVTPTLNNPRSTVKVNGISVSSGGSSDPIALSVGDNVISTEVTAEDGVTHKTYAVTITRTTSGLNSLYLPGGDGPSPLSLSLNQKVEANNILSPNGDGINDIWVVKNIAFYPDNTVTVYDRLGKIVFTKKGYTNDWGGTYRDSVLNEGTYYYSINLGDGNAKKGFITVVSH